MKEIPTIHNLCLLVTTKSFCDYSMHSILFALLYFDYSHSKSNAFCRNAMTLVNLIFHVLSLNILLNETSKLIQAY